MTRSFFGWLLIPSLLLAAAVPAMAQQGQDFPPGLFTDGLQHSIADGQGKLVVLYFFETK